jgi:hypothetical protein
MTMTTANPTLDSAKSGPTHVHADAFCRLLVSRRHLERTWSRSPDEVAVHDRHSGATVTTQAVELDLYLARRPPGASKHPA